MFPIICILSILNLPESKTVEYWHKPSTLNDSLKRVRLISTCSLANLRCLNYLKHNVETNLRNCLNLRSPVSLAEWKYFSSLVTFSRHFTYIQASVRTHCEPAFGIRPTLTLFAFPVVFFSWQVAMATSWCYQPNIYNLYYFVTTSVNNKLMALHSCATVPIRKSEPFVTFIWQVLRSERSVSSLFRPATPWCPWRARPQLTRNKPISTEISQVLQALIFHRMMKIQATKMML